MQSAVHLYRTAWCDQLFICTEQLELMRSAVHLYWTARLMWSAIQFLHIHHGLHHQHIYLLQCSPLFFRISSSWCGTMAAGWRSEQALVITWSWCVWTSSSCFCLGFLILWPLYKLNWSNGRTNYEEPLAFPMRCCHRYIVPKYYCIMGDGTLGGGGGTCLINYSIHLTH